MNPGAWTIFHGAGAALILGTPCGRQFASGSSLECDPSSRCSYRVLAHGWKGTSPGFRSAAMSRTYLFALGSQMPERSGWPSAAFGAGAVRAVLFAGRFFHCAASGAAQRIKETTAAIGQSDLACIADDYIAVTGRSVGVFC